MLCSNMYLEKRVASPIALPLRGYFRQAAHPLPLSSSARTPRRTLAIRDDEIALKEHRLEQG